MDSTICFEMSVFVVEAIRGRGASFMILTGTVSEIWTDKCTYFCSIDSGISFLVLAHILTPSIVLARSVLSRLVGILVLTPYCFFFYFPLTVLWVFHQIRVIFH